MPISPARAAAFEVLMRVEKTEAYASEMLHSAQFAKLSAADHGLLTELVMGVLRWRSVLDETIAQRMQKPHTNREPEGPLLAKPARSGSLLSDTTPPLTTLARLDLEVLTGLRLGAYQLLFLNRVPGHAAVNESVELVKRARKRSAAGLVNAVLRKITATDFARDSAAAHPQWMLERWERNYGAEITRKICDYDQVSPEIAVRILQPAKTGKPKAAAGSSTGELPPGRVRLVPGRLLTHAAIARAGDITQTAAYRERQWIIQDEGSQLVALLAGQGQKILDCCAAPGGKTRILAEKNPRAEIVALELHPHRAALLRKLVPAANVRVAAADVRAIPLRLQFDCVLVDAPCTGTGTLARNPEIKWRLGPEDIRRLQTYQIEILNSAMQMVAPGGRLVYSTCSLEPEENEAVIERALTAAFHVVDCRPELLRLQAQGELAWKDVDSLTRGPYLRTIPGVQPCDGFFAAILNRRG
jgi:16S rRNA (cytosine967-C5)-methyltransferase